MARSGFRTSRQCTLGPSPFELHVRRRHELLSVQTVTQQAVNRQLRKSGWSSSGSKGRDRSQRGFTVPAREIIPGVLSRIQDAPLTGQRPAGSAARAPARTRRRGCQTTSWRTSPPLRATRSLNVAIQAAIPAQGRVCRFSMPTGRDSVLFADRSVNFSRLSVAPDEALEHVIRSRYSPANSGVRWDFR